MEEEDKAYLKCKVTEGMFPDEYCAETELYNREIISGFFPKDLFKKNNLEVKVCERKGDKALITVPNNGFLTEKSSKCILVKTNHLKTL